MATLAFSDLRKTHIIAILYKTFKCCFLAKIDLENELVRHFLIEPSKKGVRLKGSNNEPTFPSLLALIYQHTLTKMALPVNLVIPKTGNVKI